MSLQQGDQPLLTGVGREKLSSESEDMFLTYLHIHRPPSSIVTGIGLHCSHRVEIWMIHSLPSGQPLLVIISQKVVQEIHCLHRTAQLFA
jgi:hypothetical protein